MKIDILDQLREEAFIAHVNGRKREVNIFDAAADEVEHLRQLVRETDKLRQERDQARRMYVNCSLRRRLPSQPVMSSRERAAELGWHDAFSALDVTRDELPDLIDLDRGIPSDGDRCQREAL